MANEVIDTNIALALKANQTDLTAHASASSHVGGNLYSYKNIGGSL